MIQSWSQAQLLCCMGEVSFMLCREQTCIYFLVTWYSVGKQETVPQSNLFSSWLPGPCFFNIKFPDCPSSFFPVPKRQWQRSGKQSKLCDLKSCSVSVCITKDADHSRMLTPFFRGERWEWFLGWRLKTACGLIEGWGWCGYWWPWPCLKFSHFRGFGLLPHSMPARCLPCDTALAWVMHPRAVTWPLLPQRIWCWQLNIFSLYQLAREACPH